jgi:hypothetical protein
MFEIRVRLQRCLAGRDGRWRAAACVDADPLERLFQTQNNIGGILMVGQWVAGLFVTRNLSPRGR